MYAELAREVTFFFLEGPKKNGVIVLLILIMSTRLLRSGWHNKRACTQSFKIKCVVVFVLGVPQKLHHDM